MQYPKKIITLAKIKNYALNYLEKFNTTEGYLKDFLYQKIKRRHIILEDFDLKENIEKVVEEFSSLGYLNDNLFAESRIKGLLKAGNPIFLIKTNLKQKNISIDTINNALANILQAANNNVSALQDLELYAALKYAKKRGILNFSNSLEEPVDRYQKNLQIMLRKGFPLEITEKVLKDFKSLEELNDYLITTENNYNL